MNHIKNLIIAILLLYNYDSFGQWTEINIMEEQSIETLNFLDDNLGYILLNDATGNAATIMKTIDGGANWVELYLPMQNGEIQDLYFYSEGEGVMLIRDLSNVVVPSLIFLTMDDGVNWVNISPETTVNGVGVGQCQFLNQNIGFFATDKVLYKTIDGGENWVSKEFDEYILSIDFLDAEHGVLGTWDGTFSYQGGMLTTSDGGLSWTNNLLNENYTSIVEVRQLSSKVALAAPVHSWAAIQAGQFYKTTDGGVNWNAIEIPMPMDGSTLRQIDFKDEMNGIICVGNTLTTNIYSTLNGGQTWVEEGIITSTYKSDLQLTPDSGYIGGKTGSFYKRSESTSSKEIPPKVSINLFPSPTKTGQLISWHSSENFTKLLIIDQTGMTIHQQYLNQNQATLPQLNSGFYFLQLLNKKVCTTTKFIVE